MAQDGAQEQTTNERTQNLSELKKKREAARIKREEREQRRQSRSSSNRESDRSSQSRNQQERSSRSNMSTTSGTTNHGLNRPTTRFGRPNTKNDDAGTSSVATNEFGEDPSSSDEERSVDQDPNDGSSTTTKSTAASITKSKMLVSEPTIKQLFLDGASTASGAPDQTMTTSDDVTTDLYARWALAGTENAQDQANQIVDQGFYLNKSADMHGSNVLHRNLRLEARLHHEIEKDSLRDQNLVGGEEKNKTKEKKSKQERRGVQPEDVFDRSVIKTIGDPSSTQSLRTIRLCEGDNVTSFVLPPETQQPIPIAFVRAPKDMRFSKTQPTWLIIHLQKILMTDHPLFVTEDYVCARLHKTYAEYLRCMKQDRCSFHTNLMLSQLNEVKMQKKEVEDFGLMEQRQGKRLINLCLELVDNCSQFVAEKERAHHLTTSVYRVWKDLKRVRQRAEVVSTSTSLHVKTCEVSKEEVAVIKRLSEVSETLADMETHLSAAGVAGMPGLVAKTAKIVADTMKKFVPLTNKASVLLSLRNETARTLNGQCEANEIHRRHAINNTSVWGRLLINGNVVCKTPKKNMLYPGFYCEFKHNVRVRVNQMPTEVVLEIWSSSGSLLSMSKKLASLPLDLPGSMCTSSSTTNDGCELSVTSVSPMNNAYSFSSTESMVPSISSRVNFSMLLSTKSDSADEERKDESSSDDDSDEDKDGDMTKFLSQPRQRFTSGDAIVATAWSVDTLDHKQSKDMVQKSLGLFLKGGDKRKTLFPVPSREARFDLRNRVIGGPLLNEHNEGTPSISIVEGAEFFDEDLMNVMSRVPHVDPNDPKNATLMEIIGHTKKSQRLGEHFRADVYGGDAQFKSANPLKYEPPKRHLVLLLRMHRKQQFENGRRPIPITDKEILLDPYYKTLLSNYEAEQRARQQGSSAGSIPLEDDTSKEGVDFYFEEILRKQKIRVQTFRQKILTAQKALKGGGRRASGNKGGLGLDAHVKEGIKPNFNLSLNISQLFAPKRKLKPSNKKRPQVAKPKSCTIRVHVINVTNAPTKYDETSNDGSSAQAGASGPSSPARKNRRQQQQLAGQSVERGPTQNDEDSDDEFDSDGLSTNLSSFVGIEFQGEEYRTSTRQGSNPQWNEPVDMPFTPQGIDGTSYTPRNLASIGDPIKISLFDERVIQNKMERRYRQGVSYRNERRFLGGISIPFSTVYVNETVHGALPLQKPVLTLGYRARGQINDGEDISPVEEHSRCDTLLRCVISVDPPLVANQIESQMNVLNAPGELKQLRASARRFYKSLGSKALSQNIQLCASDMTARSVLVCRYISPQSPPDEIFSNSVMVEADAIQSIVRYVSLIPFMDDWITFGGDTNQVWCTSQQFLDLGCGDWEEHAILLCNFFNSYDQSRRTGYESYIILGRGLPEGETVYTLRMDPTRGTNGSNVTLWNASTGRGYTAKGRSCPLLHVDMIANSQNIWINKQPSSHPAQMTFDLEDTTLFKPFFTEKNPIPDTLNYVNNAELTHIPSDLKNAAMMERELQETLKNEFRSWRQEAENGLKTFTRFDQNVSMALKPLLESFEASKQKMDGFSEDSKFFFCLQTISFIF